MKMPNIFKNHFYIQDPYQVVQFIVKIYVLYTILAILVITLYQEYANSEGMIRMYMYKNWFQKPMFYRYENRLDIQKKDSEYRRITQLEECQVQNISKQDLGIYFYKNYVTKAKPCLLSQYMINNQDWSAINNWQNDTYLKEKAGEEIVEIEKVSLQSNEFAYYKKAFGKEYMQYKEFLDIVQDPNRDFNYYFAEEAIPNPLKADTQRDIILGDILNFKNQYIWQGQGTISLAHTDCAENIICSFRGQKRFLLVSPFETNYVYPGQGSSPKNYSPINFDKPDYNKYPMFKKANVIEAIINRGDCLYIPGQWWHQTLTSQEMCIAITTWYDVHSEYQVVLYDYLIEHD